MVKLGAFVGIFLLAAWSAAACSVLVFSNRRQCTEAEPVRVIELVDPFGDEVHDAGAQ